MTKTLKKYFAAGATAATALAGTAGTALAQIPIQDVTPQTGYASDFGLLLNSVLTLVMVIAALLVFVYLIWGGIEWISSGGDKSKTESARNKITAAIIGLIVLAASYAVLMIALRFLGFDSLQGVFGEVQVIQ